ncbi:hypothetical protein ACFQH6_15980 [Halobacteriaceae archaeon GCM10025711]
MTRSQLALGVAGAAVLAAVLGAGGAVTGTIPVDALVSLVGNDYLLVSALAGVAALVAVPVVVSGREGNLVQAAMPDPEGPVTAPPPGSGFDDDVDGLTFALPVVGHPARERVRERLRAAAIGTISRTDGRQRAAAVRMVDEGTWTDDRHAAAFVGDSVRSPGIGVRLATLATGETWSQQAARRAAEAVADYADGGDR